jgi:sugar lactone lactonase YvrE
MMLVGLPLWSSKVTTTTAAERPLSVARPPDISVSWSRPLFQDVEGHVVDVNETWSIATALADLDKGGRVPRIQCQPGYDAYVYARDLVSPDGLAFDPAGILHVAEEEAGRVSRIEPDGTATTVVDGLANPEGLAFDPAGNLYVVEDVQGGRLVRIAPDGSTTELATHLDAPEGVVWTPGGTVYITESNVEFTANPVDFRTRVTAVSPLGQVTSILTDSLLWSYSGITVGKDGLLYVSNEASGIGTDESVITVNPGTGERKAFARGLTAPEGLRFVAHGGFPLLVAQEQSAGGTGQLSAVESDGKHTVFCTGLDTIEDIAVDQEGHLYVSEDGSGWIIVIRSPWSHVYLPLVLRTHTGTR